VRARPRQQKRRGRAIVVATWCAYVASCCIGTHRLVLTACWNSAAQPTLTRPLTKQTH
jgi:hypothetical protein